MKIVFIINEYLIDLDYLKEKNYMNIKYKIIIFLNFLSTYFLNFLISENIKLATALFPCGE